MKKLFTVIAVILFSIPLFAQMALENTYTYSNGYTLTKMINLQNSGRKYSVVEYDTVNSTVTSIKLYNLNHSLWKTITPPAISGYKPDAVYYISENLFKMDNKVDMAITYGDGFNIGFGKCVFIDETGGIITQVNNAGQPTVYDAGGNSFKAAIYGRSHGTYIYSLPGTIPGSLGNGLGLAKASLSAPIPNPSSNQVKIEYSLPNGVNEGVLEIYTSAGIRLHTYQIDRNFTDVALDSSDLPAGTYYYNIVAGGGISESKKLLVVK